VIFAQAPGRTGGVAKPVYLAWRPKLNSNDYSMLATSLTRCCNTPLLLHRRGVLDPRTSNCPFRIT